MLREDAIKYAKERIELLRKIDGEHDHGIMTTIRLEEIDCLNTLISSSLKQPSGLESVEKCPNPSIDCPDCNDDGNIVRDVSIGEALEEYKKTIRQYREFGRLDYPTTSGARIRAKSNK